MRQAGEQEGPGQERLQGFTLVTSKAQVCYWDAVRGQVRRALQAQALGAGCTVPGSAGLSLTTFYPDPPKWLLSLRPQRIPRLPSPNCLCVCVSSRALRDPRGQ